jgi:hypothetical protein
MRQHGVEFLKTSSYVTENSSTPKTLWYLVHIAHDLLQPDALTHPKYQKGRASLGFVSESLSVRIYQSASFPDLSRVDPVALGLLAFGRLLYPDLRPIYGWIDEPSGNIPETSGTCLASEGYEVSHTGGGNRGGSQAGAVRTDIR